MGFLDGYKSFVRKHPSLIQNAERLLHWVAWNPERFSGSEFAYEGFNAAVGLLGIYNESILAHSTTKDGQTNWALWLAAVEQVRVVTGHACMARCVPWGFSSSSIQHSTVLKLHVQFASMALLPSIVWHPKTNIWVPNTTICMNCGWCADTNTD